MEIRLEIEEELQIEGSMDRFTEFNKIFTTANALLLAKQWK